MNKIFPIFNGKVKQGKLTLYNRPKFDEYLMSIDGEVAVVVKRKRKIRSLSANNYYWLCLGLAGDHFGYDPEELHDSFKSIFLTDHTTKIPLIRSTTKLNTEQFSIYLDKVIRKLAEMDFVCPTIEDYYASNQTDN